MSRASEEPVTGRGPGGASLSRVLARLTARQLLGRRRTLPAGAIVVLPILLAVLFLLIDSSTEPHADAVFAVFVNNRLMLGLLVPILALVLGTAVLGAEIEDGTAVFLLSKPVERRRILAVKTAMAAVACALLVTPASMISTWLITGSPSEHGLMPGLGLSVLIAAVAYTVVFVALSALTHRAIVFGLVYVFLWESLITNVFPGMSWVSLSDYAYGWGEVFITSPTVVSDELTGAETDVYDPSFGVVPAVIGSLAVLAGAGWAGAAALARFQIRERK